jgi:hypothetical protein
MNYRDKGRKNPEAIEKARKAASQFDEDLQETLEPQAIQEISDDYIQECIEQGKRPTMEGLSSRLGVTSDVFKRWLKPAEDSKDRHKERRIACKKAMDKMSDILQQGKDTVSIFLLKQQHYGGYTDKQETDNKGDTVHIKVSFGGKKG